LISLLTKLLLILVVRRVDSLCSIIIVIMNIFARRLIRLTVSEYDGGLFLDTGYLILDTGYFIEPAEKTWGTICHVSHRFCCDVSSGVQGSYHHLSITGWLRDSGARNVVPALQWKNLLRLIR